mgnify:CR=1 FL=1
MLYCLCLLLEEHLFISEKFFLAVIQIAFYGVDIFNLSYLTIFDLLFTLFNFPGIQEILGDGSTAVSLLPEEGGGGGDRVGLQALLPG